jgi:hypothetical protein
MQDIVVTEFTSGTEWEVKLGAGILPVKVTDYDRQYWSQISVGTFAMPRDYDETSLNRLLAAIAAVNKYEAEKIKPCQSI